MTTPQKALNKVQRQAVDRLCISIRLIEELVPLELQRFSMQRKRKLENAHVALSHHASTFDLSLPPLSTLYQPRQYLAHAFLVADHLKAQLALAWQHCEKRTPTRARPLMRSDFEARQGIIETREGPVPFGVGDYLALDSLGEYPISRVTLEQRYIQVAPLDAAGWGLYRSTEQREACQQFRAFPTDCGATGLAGDYLMRGQEGRTWPCAKAKFVREYRFLERKASTK